MIYEVYWRGADRRSNKGFVRARSRDEAYDFAMKSLRKDKVLVTAVYNASPWQVTKESRCLNFNRG